MAAIIVRQQRIARIAAQDITTLRVLVDRSLVSAGGPGAGTVVTIPVTVETASILLPQITLYETATAPDAVTQGAIYTTQLLDINGQVVAYVPGFAAFTIRIPSAETTWNELRESNDFQALIQSAVTNRLGLDTTPTVGQSVITVIGGASQAGLDTINLFFGSSANPPGIRHNVATGQMEFSHNGLTWASFGGGGGGGSVTSVGLSLPAIFSVSGSPVTTTGTLTGTLVNQSANTIFAGPTSGGAAVPTFRALVANDYPTMVGDSGAGGTKGAVPAPAAGDAAANKFLKADGTWAVAGASSGADPTASLGLAAINGVATTFMRSDAAPALNQAIVPTWTGAHLWNGVTGTFRRDAIGVTSTNGLILENTTAAAAGAQQRSPGIQLTGQGWKTNATATSQTVDWRIDNLPVQGAANPTSTLVVGSQVNGAGFVDKLYLTSGNILAVVSSNPGSIVLHYALSNGSSIQNSGFGGRSDAGVVSMISAGTAILSAASLGGITQANLGSHALGWNSSSSAGSAVADLLLRRVGAANLGFGALDAAAASVVAQTISVQNVVSGSTNGAGQPFTVRGSLGTSQGVPGRIHIQTGALIAASGTTQQTPVDREIFGASKVLTNNTVTTVCNVTVANNTAAGGIVDYTVEVFDGTDLQVETGEFVYQVTNKGGTIANNTITSPTGYPKNVATAGTLTVTWTISNANPALLAINANSSLTPSTGYPRVTYNLRNHTQQAVAIQ